MSSITICVQYNPKSNLFNKLSHDRQYNILTERAVIMFNGSTWAYNKYVYATAFAVNLL